MRSDLGSYQTSSDKRENANLYLEVVITRNTNLILPTHRCETEAKMFWFVWGSSCVGMRTQQQRKGEKVPILLLSCQS